MEVAISGEVLPDQSRADHVPIALDQGPAGQVRQKGGREARHGRRHGQAEKQGEADDQGRGGTKQRHAQAIPSIWSMRSMTLIPAKGATIPPSP